MNQKVVFITGANSGIGKAIALRLSREGAHVIMVCRNPEKGEAARVAVARESGDHKVDLMIADLSSIEDTIRLANQVLDNYDGLDVLINNAGVILPNRKETVDGLETQFAVNYLAPFILSSLLKPLLINRRGRIIHVSSGAHKIGKFNFLDLQLKRGYSAFKAYSQSKLALTMLTMMQAEAYKDSGVTVNCLHPGAVATNISVDRASGARVQLMKWLSLFFLSPEDGAETAIFLAKSHVVDNESGGYYYKSKQNKPSKLVYDNTLRQQLLKHTLEILNPFGITDL